MRIRVTLRIVLRGPAGGRVLPDEVHQAADCLMVALLRSRETERIQNVSTGSDAEDDIVTAEAVIEAPNVELGVARFGAVTRELLAPTVGSLPESDGESRFEVVECLGALLK